MKNRRSSTVEQNQLERSTASSVLPAGKWRPSSNSLLGHEQNEVSAKNFIRSCAYRQEHIDRQTVIKRQDMESSLQRLSSRDDVDGVMVVTMDGRMLYTGDALIKWIPALTSLCSFARDVVRGIDPDDSIQVFRLRTKTYEMISTLHGEQLLIVKQTLSGESNLDTAGTNSAIEEDWQAFLQRLQQQKTNSDF